MEKWNRRKMNYACYQITSDLMNKDAKIDAEVYVEHY